MAGINGNMGRFNQMPAVSNRQGEENNPVNNGKEAKAVDKGNSGKKPIVCKTTYIKYNQERGKWMFSHDPDGHDEVYIRYYDENGKEHYRLLNDDEGLYFNDKNGTVIIEGLNEDGVTYSGINPDQ